MPPVRHRFNVRVPMTDGCTLAADLTLPEELPAPAVLIRTPYGKSGELQSSRAAVFAAAGYIAVLMDVRGRGDSDGVFEPYRNDGPDGADAIGWLAEQEWCDGAVATHGASYGGRIQWLTALEQPPALRAMVSVVAPSDPFVENPTGTPGPMHLNWFRLVDARTPQYREQVDWMSVYRHRPLRTMDEAAGFLSPAWREQLEHRTLDEWWEPARYQHRIGEIDLPVLHISGWYDDEEIGTPLNYSKLMAAGRGGQRLLMGPWGHAVNTTRKLGEVDFGPHALIDLDAAIIAFLDEHVRGRVPDPTPSAVRIFLMGANEWRDETSWPPPGAVEQAWHLHSAGRANSRYGDGVLHRDAPADDEPPDSWVHDPDRPVPFITEPSSAQLGGPDDYAGVEGRGDVLVYTSDPLMVALDVVGPVRLMAHVDTSARDTDVTAKLVNVHPNGFAQRLCDGVTRLRYRDGFDAERPVRPGEVYQVEVVMWDTCIRLPAGHRLRLEVASAAFPKYDVNLGTGGDPSTETDGVIAENRIWHTAERPSRLLLTTLR